MIIALAASEGEFLIEFQRNTLTRIWDWLLIGPKPGCIDLIFGQIPWFIIHQ